MPTTYRIEVNGIFHRCISTSIEAIDILIGETSRDRSNEIDGMWASNRTEVLQATLERNWWKYFQRWRANRAIVLAIVIGLQLRLFALLDRGLLRLGGDAFGTAMGSDKRGTIS